MKQRKWWLLVLMAGVLAAGPADLMAQEDGEEKADYTTPRGAAKAFARALERGDGEGVKAASIADESRVRIIDAMTGMVEEFRKLHKAAVERYGEAEAEAIGQMGGSEVDWVERVDQMELREEGEVARLVDVEDPESHPMELRQVNGEWKVDVNAMLGQQGMVEEEQVTQAVSILEAMGGAAGDVAEEIASGRYETADAAVRAVETRMYVIMMGGAVAPAPPEAPESPEEGGAEE